jgi:hypothetical protein
MLPDPPGTMKIEGRTALLIVPDGTNGLILHGLPLDNQQALLRERCGNRL